MKPSQIKKQVVRPKYPDMDGPGTEYAPGSQRDKDYTRGYEDAVADVAAERERQAKQALMTLLASL